MNAGRLKFLLAFLLVALFASCKPAISESEKFASLTVDPKNANVEFFWRDNHSKPFKSLQNVKNFVEAENKKLRFATNGGMFEINNQPKGLFVQNGETLAALDTKAATAIFISSRTACFM